MAEKPSEQSIFLHAVGLGSPADRAAYLADVCRDNPQLRLELDALLAAHDRLGAEQPPSGPELPRTMDEPATERPGTVIGPYKLLQKIGEGGMGTVFMAEQLHPVQRKVALKIIKPGLDSRQVIARFQAERQALALMDHPNIARVLDAGTTDTGRPYFVMELVKGMPITRYCDEHRLTPKERLELFIPVCQAIQHAHHKGIVHRDIKPSNVMVCIYDAKPVPKVIDFGVAKAAGPKLTEQTLFTEFGAIVGTFEYMSPEQAQLDQLDIDTRSDIYSLGVLLYELLTGTTPLERKRLKQVAVLELLRLVREEDAPRPSTRLSTAEGLPSIAANRGTEPKKLSSLMRGELDWIVMKCLEKDRDRRYETANGFAQDIQRYLADEPVEACPPSAGYRLRKFIRKYRTPLRVMGGFLLLLILGVIVSTWQAIRATLAEGTAQESKREADDAKEQAEKRGDALATLNDTLRRANYIADMNLAHHAWAENNLIRTRELLDQHRPNPGEPDQRGFEWHYLRRLFDGELKVVQAHATVTALAFAPNGKRLVSCGRSRVRRDMKYENDPPRDMKLWEVATGRQLPLELKGPTGNAMSVAVSPDGTLLAAACGTQGVHVWDLATGESSTLARQRNELDRSVGFSADGKQLVSLAKTGKDNPELNNYTVRVWDLAERKAIATLDKLSYTYTQPEWSPDGKLMAYPESYQNVVRVFDTATGREVFSYKYRGLAVTHAVFSPDGNRLAACGEAGVQLWDVATHEALSAWPTSSHLCEFLAYSPDGRRLAVGTFEGAVELWDTGTGQKAATFSGHAGPIQMVAFSPGGTRLASAGHDGTVRVWDTTGRHVSVRFSSTAEITNYVSLSPNGQTVFELTFKDQAGRFFDATTGEPRAEPIPINHIGQNSLSIINSSFDWTADGKRFFISEAGKQIKVCDAISGKVVREFPIDADGQNVLAVSPDGNWCAHPFAGGAIKVRDAQTGAEVRTITGLEEQLHYLVFSPDGSRLLGADKRGLMRIWDLATGRETLASRLNNVFVFCIRFSPDGKRLAVVGNQMQSLVGEARVLDAETGRELLALKGHSVLVTDAAFTPDGQRLATCSTADHTVRLWDLASGQEILTLRGHDLRVLSIRFVSAGRRLIGVSKDDTVRLWDATRLAE
jgi:WD40 repeat protein/serine/threonine protein kinase